MMPDALLYALGHAKHEIGEPGAREQGSSMLISHRSKPSFGHVFRRIAKRGMMLVEERIRCFRYFGPEPKELRLRPNIAMHGLGRG